jgi:hypothetical protein
MDLDQFQQELRPRMQTARDQISTTEQLEEATNRLVADIQAAIEKATPIARITPRLRPGFNDECREAI